MIILRYVQTYVMDSKWMKRFQRYISEDVTKSAKTEYMRLEDEVRQFGKWPPPRDSLLDLTELLRQDNALLDKPVVVKTDGMKTDYNNPAFEVDSHDESRVVMNDPNHRNDQNKLNTIELTTVSIK